MVNISNIIKNFLKNTKNRGFFQNIMIYTFSIPGYLYKKIIFKKVFERQRKKGEKSIKINLFNGSKFEVSTDDFGLSLDLYISKIREPLITLYLVNFLKERNLHTFIDIGANIGYYTVVLSKFFRKIVSIEPSKRALELLRKNVKINNLEKKVEIINAAVVSKKDLNKNIFFNESDQLNLSSLSEKSGMKIKKIEFIKCIEKYKPSFVKMDIEGYESEIIPELSKCKYKPPLIFVEIHFDLIGKEKSKKIFKILSKLGYKIRIAFKENKLPENQLLKYLYFIINENKLLLKNIQIDKIPQKEIKRMLNGKYGAVEFLFELNNYEK